MAKNYKSSSSAAATQDKNDPIIGTKTEMVTPQLMLRATDRSPKDRGTLRAAHIAGESIYYPNLSRLLDIFEDIMLDGHLFGIIKKRISQVVNKKLIFLDAQGEEDAVMAKVIRTKVFKDIMRQILWTKMFGINGLEFIPGKKLAFNLIPKKHIKRKTQKITFEQFGLTEGIDYAGLENVWIMGDPHDLGLLLVCGYIVMLKKGAISDWAQYIELFGSPAIVLKYKGFDTQAKVAADKILANIGNSMRITIPEEMGLTFEDGKMSNGDGKLQETFRQACNEELSILVLGNTETTGHSKTGTGAKSNTHAQQQLELIKDDMDDICDALNSEHFMNILRAYNLPVDGGEFVFDKEIDINTLSDKILIDEKLIKLGLPVGHKYLYQTYGIPEPKPGDPIIAMPGLSEEEDEPETNPTPNKPKPAKKPAARPKAVSMTEISAMLDQKLKDFFGHAR